MDRKNRKVGVLIAEYLSGEISHKRMDELEKVAKNEGISLNDFLKIYQNFDQFDIPEPGEKMDENFYKMLGDKRHSIENQSNWWISVKDKLIDVLTVPKVPRMAYGFIFLLIGIVLGNLIIPDRSDNAQIADMSQEITEMRKSIVLSMIEKKQATDRIMAVSYANEMDKADNSVIDALFKTLNNDENVNERLASLDALLRFTDLSTVRQGMIESLKHQESPMVLIELSSVLIQLQEKSSIKEFKNILKKKDLDPNLRLTIEEGIQTLI